MDRISGLWLRVGPIGGRNICSLQWNGLLGAYGLRLDLDLGLQLGLGCFSLRALGFPGTLWLDLDPRCGVGTGMGRMVALSRLLRLGTIAPRYGGERIGRK